MEELISRDTFIFKVSAIQGISLEASGKMIIRTKSGFLKVPDTTLEEFQAIKAEYEAKLSALTAKYDKYDEAKLNTKLNEKES